MYGNKLTYFWSNVLVFLGWLPSVCVIWNIVAHSYNFCENTLIVLFWALSKIVLCFFVLLKQRECSVLVESELPRQIAYNLEKLPPKFFCCFYFGVRYDLDDLSSISCVPGKGNTGKQWSSNKKVWTGRCSYSHCQWNTLWKRGSRTSFCSRLLVYYCSHQQ